MSNPASPYYREGFNHALKGQQFKGYGGREKAVNYGAGYKKGTLVKKQASFEKSGKCPHPGCNVKHKNFDTVYNAHFRGD